MELFKVQLKMKKFPINSYGSIIIFELHDDKDKIDINFTLYQG